MANLYDTDGRKRPAIIRIPRFEIGEHYTVYTIELALGPFKWSVNRRFSEFSNLHDELWAKHKLREVDLPAKKIFGNQSYGFVQRRQKELEEYLRRLFDLYGRPPPPLSRFTLWDKYEVHGITATMSSYVLGMGPSGAPTGPEAVAELRQHLPFEFSVLQVHAINARIDSPAPTNDLEHMKYDVGHIMNFVTHLPAVRVWGSSGHFGTSNIIMNQLRYDLSVFKELEALELVRVDLTHLRGVDQLKRTMTKVVVHHTLQTLKELLLQDLIDCQLGQDSTLVQCWSRVREADFADNSLRAIDESVKLLPNVQTLVLAGNQIPAIANLEHLSELRLLDLSRNGITDLINLNAKLGNIKELILVENRLSSLLGLSKVYSLQSLDVSRNQISEIIEVCHIGRLPCLENLRLTENPVTLVPDYRTKVFEQFGERAPELRLDGKRGTQKELDTAAVLQAIQRAKQHRSSLDLGVRGQPAGLGGGSGPLSTGGARTRRVASPAGSSSSSPRARPTQLLPSRDASSSLGPDIGAGAGPQRPPETMARRDMEALKSRGGKQWLVEYNQMLDQRQAARQRDEAAAETAAEVRTAARLTVEASDSEHDEEEGQEEKENKQEAEEGMVDWADAAAHDQLEGRAEQALARLLHCPAPPTLTACVPALALSGPADESALPSGGAAAVTADGRVLVLVRRPRGPAGADEAFDDATGLGLLLHMEAPNLAQVVRGHHGLYLRLEERFASGPEGVLLLLTLRPELTDRLADAVVRPAGLSVLSVDRVRQRQLEEYARRQEGGRAAPVAFHGLALCRVGPLRHLVSALVTARRLHLLDERLDALPPPLFAASAPEESFLPLGSYSRAQLLQEEAGEAPADPTGSTDVLSEDDFFRHAATVRLVPDARATLQTLDFGFQTAHQRDAFLAALAAMEEPPSGADGAPAVAESPGPEPAPSADVAGPGPMPFQRWDALSAAVKHRVASSAEDSCPLRHLLDMDSAQLSAFFKRHVRPEPANGAGPAEQLVAVMWTYWLHYRSRRQEALACVFLTDACVHVVFDDWAVAAGAGGDSASTAGTAGSAGTDDPTLAFKSLTRRAGPESGRWSVRVFALPLRVLGTVYVGPFNQYVRLSGDGRDHDCTLVTRDFRLTENLLDYLRAVFRAGAGPVRLERGGPAEPDADDDVQVYRQSARPASVERLGPKSSPGGPEIRFPSDEVLSEMMFVVEEAVQAHCSAGGGGAGGSGRSSVALSSSPHGALLDSLNLLYYLLLEHLSIDFVEYVACSSPDHLMSVLLLTDDYLVILRQNIAQYPIPEFETGPPERAQFAVLDVRRLRCLTHLTLNSCDRRLLVLSFAAAPLTHHPGGGQPGHGHSLSLSHSADELAARVPASPGLASPAAEVTPGLPLSASASGLDAVAASAPGCLPPPATSSVSPPGDPVHISAYIQNPRDVDKLVKLMRAAWREFFPGLDLPVHRS